MPQIKDPENLVGISKIDVSSLPSSNKTDITIVTAFFDIGNFGKGSKDDVRKTYFKWAKTFRLIQNPLVVYTDSDRLMDQMKSSRTDLQNITKLFWIDRNSSWAFRRKDIIKDIFAMKGYPVYYPNTVVPEYSCLMHAKYDVVSRAVKQNYFHTKYFAWLDIGFFRSEVNNSRTFILQLPPGFDPSRIAVTRVANLEMDMDISRIFLQKMDWVGGGIFIGERELMLKYTEQYKRAVDYFLSKRLMNTDQQVLYAMYSEQGRKELNTSVKIQLFESKEEVWFNLGYSMRKYT